MTARNKNKKAISFLKNVAIYSAFLIVIWGFYRLLFQLPDEIEEIIIKPVIWLIPLVYFVFKEKGSLDSLGITLKNLFPSLYLALGLGAIFIIEALISNYLKYGGFKFSANIGGEAFGTTFLLSSATAFTEEVSFRGYIFNRLWQALGRELPANLMSTLLWVVIHIPMTIFVWKLQLSAALVYLLLTAIFGIGSAFIFARTKNVFSSILLHLLWEWPIILFR